MSGGQKYLNIGTIGQSRISTGPMQHGNKGLSHSHHNQQQSQYSSPQQQQKRRIIVPQQQSTTNQQQQHNNYLKSSPNSKLLMQPPKGASPGVKKAAHGASHPVAGPSTSARNAQNASALAKPRRKASVKLNKGLRHFSMKVCEKVKEKGTTTYNEVADELVEDEIKRVEAAGDRSFDQKNIRRRVYDALNVLMAMNIIAKEKKAITWLGLPNNTPAQCATLDGEIETKRASIAAKEKELKDLLLLQVSLKNLVNRNRASEELGYIPTPNSHIQLPFIVVNTHRDTRINCTISQDKTEYFFKFDDKFELNDHVTVLQRMGLLMGLDTGTSTDADIEKLKKLVPDEFQNLIEDYGRGKISVDVPEETMQVEDLHDSEELVEYVDMSSIVDQDIEEEYSEEDTIIEEGY